MNERIRQLKPYPMVELARRKAALIDQGVDVLDFGTGDPVEPTAPLIREALKDKNPIAPEYQARGEFSRSSIACSAAGLGAPVTVQAHIWV